jgi:flagellar biosynthesis protein FlhA
MDGASKFVKGDAIAGVIIIVINIAGGFIIGVLQLGIAPLEALQRFTLLTVGDGLVTQIPALVISTATGIIVTRAASDGDLGRDVARQVLMNPRVIGIVAVVLVVLGLVPGMPKLPFFVSAAALGGVAWMLRRMRTDSAAAEAQAAPAAAEPESFNALLAIDPMELEIGFALVPLVDVEQGGNLLNRITLVRRQIALDLGLIMPTVRIRDSMLLDPNQYQIKLRGVVVASGDIRADRLLAMNPGLADQEVEGIPTTEPAFGLPATWIARDQRERAEILGYTVVDPASVIATHLTETVKTFAPVILSRQDVANLIENLKADYPAVVEDLIPNQLAMGDVQRVLQNLLREGISIRDLLTILETLANYAKLTNDPDVLSEFVRQALQRAICAQYADDQGVLHVLTLDPELQELLMQSLTQTERGFQLAPDADLAQRMVQNLAQEMERMASQGYQPTLVTPAQIRQPFRRYIETTLPRLTVLSYGELAPNFKVQTKGMVTA